MWGTLTHLNKCKNIFSILNWYLIWNVRTHPPEQIQKCFYNTRLMSHLKCKNSVDIAKLLWYRFYYFRCKETSLALTDEDRQACPTSWMSFGLKTCRYLQHCRRKCLNGSLSKNKRKWLMWPVWEAGHPQCPSIEEKALWDFLSQKVKNESKDIWDFFRQE